MLDRNSSCIVIVKFVETAFRRTKLKLHYTCLYRISGKPEYTASTKIDRKEARPKNCGLANFFRVTTFSAAALKRIAQMFAGSSAKARLKHRLTGDGKHQTRLGSKRSGVHSWGFR
jgi:hypothetical protein